MLSAYLHIKAEVRVYEVRSDNEECVNWVQLWDFFWTTNSAWKLHSWKEFHSSREKKKPFPDNGVKNSLNIQILTLIQMTLRA